MKVSISKAKQMLGEIYQSTGIDDGIADWLVELALDYDLEGNFFSGFEDIEEDVKKINPALHVVLDVDRPALKLVNGHGQAAKIVVREIMDDAVEWAHKQGLLVIGFKNCGYHGNLGTVARKFAEHNLVCVYSSNGGPQGVVPYGGTKDVFGTNPLAYGIPTSSKPIVFDAATAERAYGTIRRARESGVSLPENTYLDASGAYTTDANKAIALIPFGGYKGYAINLLLEVLTGVLVGAKSGTLVSGDPDIGGILLLIDPSAFVSLEEFKAQTDQIIVDVQNNPPAPGFDKVRVPGYRGQELRERQLREGSVEVDDSIWQKFVEFHKATTSKDNLAPDAVSA